MLVSQGLCRFAKLNQLALHSARLEKLVTFAFADDVAVQPRYRTPQFSHESSLEVPIQSDKVNNGPYCLGLSQAVGVLEDYAT